MSVISRRVARELSDQEFRNTYKRARVRSKLSYQIRALRKQRDWLQGKLAEVMGKPQSTVSRFEDADYGKLNLETLFEISDAFDLGLIVEFVSYPEFLVRTSNLAPAHLYAASFNEKSLAFLTRNEPPSMHVHDAANKQFDKGIIEVNVSGRGQLVSAPDPDNIRANITSANTIQGTANV
jgi:transcriptional regulator with XRE-family HTH domain